MSNKILSLRFSNINNIGEITNNTTLIDVEKNIFKKYLLKATFDLKNIYNHNNKLIGINNE